VIKKIHALRFIERTTIGDKDGLIAFLGDIKTLALKDFDSPVGKIKISNMKNLSKKNL
jgi:hypothetical protein